MYKSNPVYSKPGDNKGNDGHNARDNYDKVDGGLLDYTSFAIGTGYGPQVLAASGYATTDFSLGLQSAIPADNVSISISLGSVVNLNVFGNAAASGNVVTQAASQTDLTIAPGKLNATYSAHLSIDVTAYVPAAHASVHLQITDSFQLSLSAKGFNGLSLTQTSAADKSVKTMTPAAVPSGGPAGNEGGTFDLARFAASVLNTGQWDIEFAGLAPGESLRAQGTSELTVNATADVLDGHRPEMLSLHETDRSSFAFNDRSGSATGSLFGMPQWGSGALGPFHTV
jgi:hypothetical protein